VYVLLIVVVGLIAQVIGSVLIREISQLGQNIPGYLSTATDAFVRLHRKYTFLPDLPAISDALRSQIGTVSSYLYNAVSAVLAFISNLVVLVVVLVLAYYMLSAQHEIKQNALRLIPPSKRRRYGQTFTEMGVKMGGWLRGELTLSLIVGAAISLFLWAIGIPYALIIGMVGALAELLPMVGPSVAAVPAILIALFEARWQLIAVIVFFTILSQMEGNFLVPRIMKQQVGLSPLITLVALLVGGTLAGAMGALLSIPLAAAAQVFIQRIVLPAIENAERGA
jgi:predicted PurR-regulated permease PerM